jgi:hypothetical protein
MFNDFYTAVKAEKKLLSAENRSSEKSLAPAPSPPASASRAKNPLARMYSIFINRMRISSRVPVHLLSMAREVPRSLSLADVSAKMAARKQGQGISVRRAGGVPSISPVQSTVAGSAIARPAGSPSGLSLRKWPSSPEQMQSRPPSPSPAASNGGPPPMIKLKLSGAIAQRLSTVEQDSNKRARFSP